MKRFYLILMVLAASLSVSAQMFRVYKGGEIVYAVSKPDSIVAFPPQDPMETVDLGLPSGTLWATCNIGAQVPEDFGDLYQWGALVPVNKSLDFLNDPSSYLFYGIPLRNGDALNYIKYNVTDKKKTLDQEDDIAYALYGENWNIPTLEQNEELYKYTTRTEEVINDIPVIRFTGKNGNSIVIPKSGFGCSNQGWLTFFIGLDAYFWLNSIAYSRNDENNYDYNKGATSGIKDPATISNGKTFYFRYSEANGGVMGTGLYRAEACPVRPVYSSR